MRSSRLFFVVMLGPVSCWAQTFDIKPGLWEMSNTMTMSGMPPIPNLEQMSPEQRARIEAGAKAMSGTPHTNTTKSCVTKDGIQDAIAQASNPTRTNTCAPKLVSMTASKVLLHIDCTQPQTEMKSTGDITIERKDSEHFVGSGSAKTSGTAGRTMDMKFSMTGAFVSSDCGDVKPAGRK